MPSVRERSCNTCLHVCLYGQTLFLKQCWVAIFFPFFETPVLKAPATVWTRTSFVEPRRKRVSNPDFRMFEKSSPARFQDETCTTKQSPARVCTERVKMSLFGAHCTPLNLQKKKKKQAGVSYDVALRMPLKSHEGQSTSEISVAAGANTSQGVSRNLMCECVYWLRVSENEIILSNTRSSATRGCGHIGAVASFFFARLNIIFYGAVVGHLFLSLTFGPTCAIKYELNWNAHILINMCNTERSCSSSNALLLKHPCCTPSTSHCTICIAWGSRPPDSRPLWCRPAAGSNPLIPPLIAVNHKRTSCCSVFSLPAFLSQFNLDIDILDKKKKLSGLQIARGMLLAGEWKSPSWVN